MIYFHSDYGQGAHPKVMEALNKTNYEYTDGYGLDPHCDRAAKLIKELIGVDDCEVHFFVGGTPCNVTLISAALKPYEAVIAARTGHAYVHETGGVELLNGGFAGKDVHGAPSHEVEDAALDLGGATV